MLTISPITHDDRKPIERLLIARGIFSRGEIDLALELVDQVLQHPEKEEYTILCARAEPANQVTGYICFGPIPITQDCYDLYWIVVDKNFPRWGIGTELLLDMEERLLRKKARRIYIDTSSSPAYQAARNFYEKNGFWVDSITEDFYKIGDDKIVYVKAV